MALDMDFAKVAIVTFPPRAAEMEEVELSMVYAKMEELWEKAIGGFTTLIEEHFGDEYTVRDADLP